VPTIKFPVGCGIDRIGNRAVNINDMSDNVTAKPQINLRDEEVFFLTFNLRLGKPSKIIKPNAINNG
jgi:hypothetical protein